MADDFKSKIREDIKRKILSRRAAIEPDDDDDLKVNSELKDVIQDDKVVTLSKRSNLNTEKSSENIPVPPPMMSNESLHSKTTKASKGVDSDFSKEVKDMRVKLKTTNSTVSESKDKNGFLHRFMNEIPYLKQDNVSKTTISYKPTIPPKPTVSPKPILSKDDERLSNILQKDVMNKMTGYNASKKLFKEDRKFKISSRIRDIASNFGDVIGSTGERKDEMKSFRDDKKNTNPIFKKENNSRSL